MVVLVCGGKAVFVVAKQLLQGGFGSRPLGVRLGILGTTRAMNHIDDAVAEFPANGLELGTVSRRQLFRARQCAPRFGFLNRQTGLENRVVPKMINIPWLGACGAMNVHHGLPFIRRLRESVAPRRWTGLQVAGLVQQRCETSRTTIQRVLARWFLARPGPRRPRRA